MHWRGEARARHCMVVLAMDDAGVITMLHSVVLAGTAAAADLVWRCR